jgi:toxin ParE1/3/4
MPRLIWSEASLRDLKLIDRFISRDDPRAAATMLQRIVEAAKLLEQYPALGPIVTGNVRFLKARRTPFVVIYKIGDDGVEIIRVRHAREDWMPWSPSDM